MTGLVVLALFLYLVLDWFEMHSRLEKAEKSLARLEALASPPTLSEERSRLLSALSARKDSR